MLKTLDKIFNVLFFKVQGLVNTFGDLRGAFAATDRINSVLSGAEIDEALAYGLNKDIKLMKMPDKEFGIFLVNGFESQTQSLDMPYTTSLKSASSVRSLAGSGDICLEGMCCMVSSLLHARVDMFHAKGVKSLLMIITSGIRC